MSSNRNKTIRMLVSKMEFMCIPEYFDADKRRRARVVRKIIKSYRAEQQSALKLNGLNSKICELYRKAIHIFAAKQGRIFGRKFV